MNNTLWILCLSSVYHQTIHKPLNGMGSLPIKVNESVMQVREAHVKKALETVDAVRSSERERIKINEALMGLLFRLDAVPGLDPNVRELRRHVSHRIVGLQEILDAVSDTRVDHWDGFLRDWDEIIVGIEKEACKDKGGGDEMERFCAEHLGFQCLQRFLRDQ